MTKLYSQRLIIFINKWEKVRLSNAFQEFLKRCKDQRDCINGVKAYLQIYKIKSVFNSWRSRVKYSKAKLAYSKNKSCKNFHTLLRLEKNRWKQYSLSERYFHLLTRYMRALKRYRVRKSMYKNKCIIADEFNQRKIKEVFFLRLRLAKYLKEDNEKEHEKTLQLINMNDKAQ